MLILEHARKVKLDKWQAAFPARRIRPDVHLESGGTLLDNNNTMYNEHATTTATITTAITTTITTTTTHNMSNSSTT